MITLSTLTLTHARIHWNTRTYIVHVPHSMMFASTYYYTMSTPHLCSTTWYTAHTYVCICLFGTRVSNFQRSFIALLMCTTATPTTKRVSIVSDAVFVILIKTIYRSKNFNPMLLSACLLPICLFQSPYSPIHSSTLPLTLLLFVWISFVTFAIWSKFDATFAKTNKHTPTTHLSKWMYAYMEKEFVTRKHWFGFSDAWHGDELNAETVIYM